MQKGIVLGNQPYLVGGGLIRSQGGWSQVKALRRIGDRQLSDERILGSGDFVENVTKAEELARKYRLTAKEREKKAMLVVTAACAEKDLSMEALRSGSRRRNVSRVRAQLSITLVEEYGLTLAETAHLLGVTTSAIARIISRSKIS